MELLQTAYLKLFYFPRVFFTEKNRNIRHAIIGVFFLLIFSILLFSSYRKGLLISLPDVPVNTLLRNIAIIGNRNRCIIVLFLLLACSILSLEKDTKPVRWNWYFGVLWLVLGVMGIIAGVSHNIGGGGVVSNLIIILILPALFFPWQGRKELGKLYQIIAFAGAVAIFIFLAVSTFYYPYSPQTCGLPGRYSAFTKHPNTLGIVTIFGTVISLYLIYKGKWLSTVFGSIIIGTCLVFLMFSMSRSSLLAAAASIFLFLFFFIKLRISYDSKMILRVVLSVLIIAVSFVWTYKNGTVYEDPYGLFAATKSNLYSYADTDNEEESKLLNLPIFNRFKNRETAGQLSSGRTVAWKVYYARLNWYGNDVKMSYPLRVVNENGDRYNYFKNAHNHALEIAYRYGIPSGVLFLFLEFLSLLYVIRCMFCRRKTNDDGDVFSAMCIVQFLAIGNLEGLYPPFSSITVVLFYIALAPLFTWGVSHKERQVAADE